MNNIGLFPEKQRMTLKQVILIIAIQTLIISSCANAIPTPSSSEVMRVAETMVAQTSRPLENRNPLQTVAQVSTHVPLLAPTQSLLTDHAPTPAKRPIGASTTYPSFSTCAGATYIRDVTVADGTKLAPGTSFTKIWRVQNTGSCAWNRHFTITFSSGDRMSGETTTIDRLVLPNDAVDVRLELTAPEGEGEYTGVWILADGDGMPFGGYIYVKIVVSSG